MRKSKPSTKSIGENKKRYPKNHTDSPDDRKDRPLINRGIYSRNLILIIAIGLGLFAWFTGGLVHYLFFFTGSSSLIDFIFTPSLPHEFFFRLVILVLFLSSALVISLVILRRTQVERKLLESEEKIMTLMSNMPGMAYRCYNDDYWTMIYVSEGCRELTGYDPEEVVNNRDISYGDMVHPDDRESLVKKVQSAVKNNRRFEVEYRIIARNGEIKWVWERGLCIPENHDKDEILEGFITDVTYNYRAKEALLKSEEKFRSITENSADAIFITDLKGRYQYVNRKACDMLGYTRSELLGMGVADISASPTDGNIPADFTDLLERKSNFIETELRRKDGKKIPVDLNAVVLPSGQVYGSCRDITERKKTEEELEKHREQLEVLVNERTAELEAKNKDLDRLNKLFIGREFRINDLKEQLRTLKGRLHKPNDDA